MPMDHSDISASRLDSKDETENLCHFFSSAWSKNTTNNMVNNTPLLRGRKVMYS